jgi:hypothetical protein
MIEPYRSALALLEPKFAEMELVLTADHDYHAIFSGSAFSLEVSAERYYPLTFGVGLVDARGKKFLTFLLEQILDPGGRAERFTKLQAMRRAYEEKNQRIDLESSRNDVFTYAVFVLDESLRFVSIFLSELIPMGPSLESEYEKRSQELMEKIHRGETTLG